MRTILLAIALLVSAGANAGELRVGRITVTTEDIFTSAEASRGWAYSATNRLHVRTRESVVRKFLLFREGDVFDPDKLAETERNLRALDFIKSASVTAAEPVNGLVDVYVVTQDSWSTEPSGSLGASGGSTGYGLELTESNVLGTGREVSLLFDTGSERTSRAIRYRDPAFFKPYWRAELLYSSNSDGEDSKIEVRRPFYSFETQWAATVYGRSTREHARIYADGVIASQYGRDKQRAELSFGHAFGASTHSALRLTSGLEWIDDEFFVLDGSRIALPADRRYRYVFSQLDYIQNRFVKMNFVNRDLRYEDFNLGWTASLRLGASLEEFGAPENTGLVSASIGRGVSFAHGGMLLLNARYRTRTGTDARNALTSIDATVVKQFPGSVRQTLVSRVRYDHGSDLDGDVQFFADGERGLRGYELYAFAGSRRLLLNVEHRVALGQELFQILSPGAAVFFDAGDAVDGRPLRIDDMKADVGVGLRIGLPRTPRNLLRLDVAWPLVPDARGEQKMIVSFSSSQAF